MDGIEKSQTSYSSLRRAGSTGKYRLVRLILVPGKVKEQILLRTISSHKKEKVVTGPGRMNLARAIHV